MIRSFLVLMMGANAGSALSGNCTFTASPLKFISEEMLIGPNKLGLVGIRGIANSIGYSVIDSIKTEQQAESPDESCHVQIANIINIYGKSVSASAQGAQAAVRATNFQDKTIQSCPGFGLCANIWDGQGQDVYPISTLTYLVVPTIISDADCPKMKIVYDYAQWILSDPAASAVALIDGFATMPRKVAGLAMAQVLDIMKCSSADNTAFRYVKDEPIPSNPLTIHGSGSSLQAGLQSSLLRAYPNAGKELI